MISVYDQPVPDKCDDVREMFKRIQGFSTTLFDSKITTLVRTALKVRRKHPTRIWDDLTNAMYKAELKVKMPTVWFRFKWRSTGGDSTWYYEDTGYTKNEFKKVYLDSLMQERVEDKARDHERGASAEWFIIDPPYSVVASRIKGLEVRRAELAAKQEEYKRALTLP